MCSKGGEKRWRSGTANETLWSKKRQVDHGVEHTHIWLPRGAQKVWATLSNSHPIILEFSAGAPRMWYCGAWDSWAISVGWWGAEASRAVPGLLMGTM